MYGIQDSPRSTPATSKKNGGRTVVTRCKVCDCKLHEGDICRRCQYERDWLDRPERFCKHCGDNIPGATEDRYYPNTARSCHTAQTSFCETAKQYCRGSF